MTSRRRASRDENLPGLLSLLTIAHGSKVTRINFRGGRRPGIEAKRDPLVEAVRPIYIRCLKHVSACVTNNLNKERDSWKEEEIHVMEPF